jgi:hypothetical protein
MAISIVPQKATASVSNAEANAEVIGNTFYANVRWTYSSYDSVILKLYHNSIEVAKGDINYGSSGEDFDYVSYSPLKKGTYRVQLWSEIDDKEVYSKEWDIPDLEISLSVTPTSGQIGTTFIATTTFATGENAPEYYSFSGTLETSAGDITFKQNIGGSIISEDFYRFYDIDDYEITPIFTSTGFTCPTEGDYTVTAKYTDSLTEITASSIKVSMEDQYEPQITVMNQELSDTKSELSKTSNELLTAKYDLIRTKKKLNETNEEIADMEKKLETNIQSSQSYAYIGILVGIIGIIFGIIGIVMGRRKRYTEPPRYSEESRQPSPRPQAPPSPVQEPPRYSEYEQPPPRQPSRQQYDDYRQPPRQQQYPPKQYPRQQSDNVRWED